MIISLAAAETPERGKENSEGNRQTGHLYLSILRAKSPLARKTVSAFFYIYISALSVMLACFGVCVCVRACVFIYATFFTWCDVKMAKL